MLTSAYNIRRCVRVNIIFVLSLVTTDRSIDNLLQNSKSGRQSQSGIGVQSEALRPYRLRSLARAITYYPLAYLCSILFGLWLHSGYNWSSPQRLDLDYQPENLLAVFDHPRY